MPAAAAAVLPGKGLNPFLKEASSFQGGEWGKEKCRCSAAGGGCPFGLEQAREKIVALIWQSRARYF